MKPRKTDQEDRRIKDMGYFIMIKGKVIKTFIF